jgi:hypothetical protein
MPEMAVATAPAQKNDRGDTALLLLALGAVGAGAVLWIDSKHKAPGGGACGPFSGPAANLPTGLYTDCSVPGNPDSCTIWWVVQGVGRWGVATPTQLVRCFPGVPVNSQAQLDALGGFGNADAPDNEYVGTIGYVSACSTCPPGT